MIEEMVYDIKHGRRFERFTVRIALVREPTARQQPRFDRPETVAEAFMALATLDRECVAVALLDVRNRLVGIHAVHIGTRTQSVVGPSDVFKAAILANASGIILVHNHPSGDPTPSRDDVGLSHRIKEAGRTLGIEVLDHIVVSTGGFVSLKQRGQI